MAQSGRNTGLGTVAHGKFRTVYVGNGADFLSPERPRARRDDTEYGGSHVLGQGETRFPTAIDEGGSPVRCVAHLSVVSHRSIWAAPSVSRRIAVRVIGP